MKETAEGMDRRAFLDRGAKLIAGASVMGALGGESRANTGNGKKLKVALVGTGNRGTGMWGRNLFRSYSDYLEMVAVCDINPKRLALANKLIGINAKEYPAGDFDRMIKEIKPDTVIITTPDCFHVPYAVRALNLGCNVISEKPLATDAEQCQLLLDTEKATGQHVTTTFNARHGNYSKEIKRVILSGELGKIISAEFHEFLDIDHGASYFRRWHGKARFSGTLLCHKASHHFDQMNWWLDAEPVEVHAFGRVGFYGGNNPFRARNCRSCAFTRQCKFFWDITKSREMMEMYVNCEDEDGYLRDGCVWDNDIDTYDAMTVEVRYNNGVILCYTLNAYMPYEGQVIAFNGQNGRLDVRRYLSQPWEVDQEAEYRFTESFKETRTWTISGGEGEHGGSDASLKDLMFKPGVEDPTGLKAGSRAGVMSSLIGIAARKSIQTGARIKIADLVNFPDAWNWGA